MEKQVIYRDNQEAGAADFNNSQDYARASLDRIVREGLTDQRAFTGFGATKSGATTVTISPGAYWVNGEVYIREQDTAIDMIGQLPLVTSKIAAIIATATDIETDLQPRDFVVDVENWTTVPNDVAMLSQRYAGFQVAYGLENATPVRPTIPADTIAIAWVTLSPTGVDTVERATESELMSLKKVAARATELEIWQAQAGDQLTTLGTDITNLNARLNQSAGIELLTRIFADVAAIKDTLELEDDYSGYGSENFLAVDQSISDPEAVGYYALVEEGLRFTDANAAETQIALFNPLEPSVKVASNGLVLPKYTEVRRLALDKYHQQLSLSQYEYQEVAFKKIAMSAKRLRFGLAKTVCINSEFWKSGRYDPATGIFTDKLGRTYQILDGFSPKKQIANHTWIRIQQYWYDTETEYYQQRVATDFTVAGAMVAQTFLNTQGGWLTSLDLYFTQAAATGAVRVLVTMTNAGKPDLDRVIADTTMEAANLVKGTNPANATHWTRVPFIPTALAAGERYAIVLITGGAHYVGLTQGANYAAGTLFYSTDGAFFQGDLTLDMMLKTNFASFEATRIEVDLASLNLSGGINDIDLAHEGVTAEGTELQFEIRPQGSSTWYTLNEAQEANPFNGLPALVNLRAVFVGTKDMMPGLRLSGSKVKVSRPATTMTWFSEAIALPAATQSVKVIVNLDYYREANHDFAVVLNDVTNSANNIAAGSVTDEVLDERDGVRKRIRRTFEWTATELTTATAEIVIKATGAVAAATEIFHGERLTYLTF